MMPDERDAERARHLNRVCRKFNTKISSAAAKRPPGSWTVSRGAIE